MAAKVPDQTRPGKLAFYLRFEQIVLVLVMVLLSTIAAWAMIMAVLKVASDMQLGEAFLDKAVLTDTFGLILTVLILLEFNHSIYVALTEHSGAIQAKLLVVITILVILRKLMLIDLTAAEPFTLLGFGGLLLALGGLYWLIANGERHRAESGQAPAPMGLPDRKV